MGELVRLEIKKIGLRIISRLDDDARLFFGRQFRLQLIGDGSGDVALNGEDIGEIAIVSLRPDMRVGAGINELRIHPHLARDALHTSFEKYATPSCFPISRRFRAMPLRYCITLVRLITFRSAIFARLVRISSCTLSAK